LVEHILGKDEVSGSIPLMGSRKYIYKIKALLYFSHPTGG
jgi:hypothetical protein